MPSAESENCSISITPMSTGTGEHWRPGMPGRFAVGCCRALMLLLFVGGVMSLLWIRRYHRLRLIENSRPV